MTIRQAIDWLAKLEQQHGSKVIVYFDCPDCKRSFTPDYVATPAVRITARGPAARDETTP